MSGAQHCYRSIFTIGKGFWRVYDKQKVEIIEWKIQKVDCTNIASIFDAKRNDNSSKVENLESNKGKHGDIWFLDKGEWYESFGWTS